MISKVLNLKLFSNIILRMRYKRIFVYIEDLINSNDDTTSKIDNTIKSVNEDLIKNCNTIKSLKITRYDVNVNKTINKKHLLYLIYIQSTKNIKYKYKNFDKEIKNKHNLFVKSRNLVTKLKNITSGNNWITTNETTIYKYNDEDLLYTNDEKNFNTKKIIKQSDNPKKSQKSKDKKIIHTSDSPKKTENKITKSNKKKDTQQYDTHIKNNTPNKLKKSQKLKDKKIYDNSKKSKQCIKSTEHNNKKLNSYIKSSRQHNESTQHNKTDYKTPNINLINSLSQHNKYNMSSDSLDSLDSFNMLDSESEEINSTPTTSITSTTSITTLKKPTLPNINNTSSHKKTIPKFKPPKKHILKGGEKLIKKTYPQPIELLKQIEKTKYKKEHEEPKTTEVINTLKNIKDKIYKKKEEPINSFTEIHTETEKQKMKTCHPIPILKETYNKIVPPNENISVITPRSNIDPNKIKIDSKKKHYIMKKINYHKYEMEGAQLIINMLGFKYGRQSRYENLKFLYSHTMKYIYYKKLLKLPLKQDYEKLLKIEKNINELI